MVEDGYTNLYEKYEKSQVVETEDVSVRFTMKFHNNKIVSTILPGVVVNAFLA